MCKCMSLDFFSGYQGNRISEEKGCKRWISERTKLRGDLDVFGLSKKWLMSKKRTPLESGVLMKLHPVSKACKVSPTTCTICTTAEFSSNN